MQRDGGLAGGHLGEHPAALGRVVLCEDLTPDSAVSLVAAADGVSGGGRPMDGRNGLETAGKRQGSGLETPAHHGVLPEPHRPGLEPVPVLADRFDAAEAVDLVVVSAADTAVSRGSPAPANLAAALAEERGAAVAGAAAAGEGGRVAGMGGDRRGWLRTRRRASCAVGRCSCRSRRRPPPSRPARPRRPAG